MKRLVFLFLITLAAIYVSAQDVDVPHNYVFQSDNDYAKYEPDVVKCIDWLLITPSNIQPDKHVAVNEFLIKWLSGTPDITISVRSDVVNFIDKNNVLLLVFMSGWAKYAIENKSNQNEVTGNLKGVEAVINFYAKNREQLRKDKNVEKYAQMKEEGSLEKYITEQLKKNAPA